MREVILLAMLATIGACDTLERNKGAAPPPTDFATDDPNAGAAVFLRSRLEGERALVDVVARSAARHVHGMAFRLHYDPEKLAFVEARASDAWSASAIRLAKEGTPGELVVTWTEKGSRSGVNATDDTVLGTLTFTAKTREPIAIAFRPERSTLRDATGAPIAIEWRGGQIASR